VTTLFIAGLDTETNSFSPIPTDEAAFRDTLLAYGDATDQPLNTCSAQLALWRGRAAALGMAVREGPCAVAEPGGPIARAFYETFRDRLLHDLAAAAPDVVLFALHGAAIAEHCDDVEGDLLQRARSIVGPDVFVGATIDPHAHLSAQMLAHASALIAYKEYPHVDVQARADELLELALASMAGTVRPVMAMWDCRMIGSFPTQRQPMRGFVDALSAAERANPKILSLSLIHGFAHGDVVDGGARMLAISDDDQALANALAEAHGRQFVSLRNAVTPRFLQSEAALDHITQTSPGNRPLLIADAGDNPGGGAPGDATFLLQACMERGLTGVALGLFYDPGAVALCQRAGVGAVLDIRLGGHFGGVSGSTIDLRGARVEALASGVAQRFGDVLLPIGDAVRLEAGGLTIIVNTHRTQVFDPVFLTGLGADPAQYRAIIVKSLNHFTELFGPLAGETIYAATPGATSPRYAELPYAKRSLNYWPRQSDPWSSQGKVGHETSTLNRCRHGA
jgi:microcystin degradation protein MlrC